MTATAPVVTLAEPCTLLDTGRVLMTTQNLLMDSNRCSRVVLHRNVTPAGCKFAFINVPAEHLLTLDLDDATIVRFVQQENQSYSLLFNSEQHALAYLSKHYGMTPANDSDSTPSVSPRPAPVNVAPLPTPPRQPRRLLSTPAYRPHGVINMSKKQPIRVFLDPAIHSRYLIQAGTHGLTPSALGERLIEYGVAQLEDGNTAPLEAPGGDAPPAPSTTEA